VCVPGDAEWALVAAGSVIGKMQTWALLSLSLHSNSAGWICNAEAPIRPPVTRTHTLALTFPANLSPSSLIFALSPASSSSLARSLVQAAFTFAVCAREKALSLSLGIRTQLSGPEAGCKIHERQDALSLAYAFLRLFGISTGLAYVHWLFVIAETAADNVTRGRLSF
jgi:hypothetical protein